MLQIFNAKVCLSFHCEHVKAEGKRNKGKPSLRPDAFF